MSAGSTETRPSLTCPRPHASLPCSKFASCIAANGDPIVHPAETVQLDYEVELTIVIGKVRRRLACCWLQPALDDDSVATSSTNDFRG